MKNELKAKLKEENTCFGTWLTIGNPDIVDILKRFPFDWFVFDTEHSYITAETTKVMMQALGEGAKATPIVRVGLNDQVLIKRALDIGAQGIIVPLVNSADDAKRAVSYCMYPPAGVRGAGPGRASGYGLNFSEYVRTANEELLVIVQIESQLALSNLEEILDTKGVDVAFVGPTDLTMSLGLIDDRSNSKVVEAMETVVRACNKHGKIPGIMAVSVKEARNAAKRGFKFISLASDVKFLVQGAKSFLEQDYCTGKA